MDIETGVKSRVTPADYWHCELPEALQRRDVPTQTVPAQPRANANQKPTAVQLVSACK